MRSRRQILCDTSDHGTVEVTWLMMRQPRAVCATASSQGPRVCSRNLMRQLKQAGNTLRHVCCIQLPQKIFFFIQMILIGGFVSIRFEKHDLRAISENVVLVTPVFCPARGGGASGGFEKLLKKLLLHLYGHEDEKLSVLGVGASVVDSCPCSGKNIQDLSVVAFSHIKNERTSVELNVELNAFMCLIFSHFNGQLRLLPIRCRPNSD
mmetsp:Transcript_253/g.579  ORF Transcript_253/g.579 Transcript_253/m.579 type:complete len:208 (-) Transcript_253:148-771(-)